ncbi:unnamed protein product, partial [Gongylonema pulchrum]|uniref:N-acetyltransferase domain-containing protein n=1 Tax=Gongylonema pulchrum TaxID=637853 RepID=A0A183ECS9_9BILA
EWRKCGFGERICQHAIKYVESRYSTKVLVTQAQLPVLKFYENLGFLMTMFYPPRHDRISTLDIWKNNLPEHEYIPGECFDPSVIKRIQEVIISLEEDRILRLLHLQHLLDERIIGRSLVRTFRECAVATLMCNFARSKELEEFLLALAWEKLNTGHYSQVDEAWRILYAAVSACKAVRLKEENHIKEALHACDMGLIMGRDIDGLSLSKYAQQLHSSLPEPTGPPSMLVEVPCALPNSIPVIAYDCPSLEKMLRLMKEQKPFIIKGIVNKWPAFEKWKYGILKVLIFSSSLCSFFLMPFVKEMFFEIQLW